MSHSYNKYHRRETLLCDIQNCQPAKWPITLLEINMRYNNKNWLIFRPISKSKDHNYRTCTRTYYRPLYFQAQKENIWLSPVQKKKPLYQHKTNWQDETPLKSLITQRLRAVSWSNLSHLTCMVKSVCERHTRKGRVIKRIHILKNCNISSL